MPRAAHLKNKTKNLDALHQWKLQSSSRWSCTRTHTTGFRVQVKRLIRDERRPHIAPRKGPLSPFLLQWSVKLWETNDLRDTALCAIAKEKEGGGGSSVVGGPASFLSFLQHPHHAIPVHSTDAFLMSPAPAAAQSATKLQSQWREQDTLPHQQKGFSHLSAWLVT